MTRKNFFKDCSWFKPDTFGITIDMPLKFYANVAIKLNQKVRWFLGLVSIFWSYREKHGKGTFSFPRCPLHNLNRLTKPNTPMQVRFFFSYCMNTSSCFYFPDYSHFCKKLTKKLIIHVYIKRFPEVVYTMFYTLYRTTTWLKNW